MDNRVYVVQEPLRRMEDGSWKPIHDLSMAEEYGNLVRLVSGKWRVDGHTGDVVATILEKLDYQDGDAILPIGDPVLIGATIAIAAAQNDGRVCVLKFDKEMKCYLKIDLDLPLPGDFYDEEDGSGDQPSLEAAS